MAEFSQQTAALKDALEEAQGGNQIFVKSLSKSQKAGLKELTKKLEKADSEVAKQSESAGAASWRAKTETTAVGEYGGQAGKGAGGISGASRSVWAQRWGFRCQHRRDCDGRRTCPVDVRLFPGEPTHTARPKRRCRGAGAPLGGRAPPYVVRSLLRTALLGFASSSCLFPSRYFPCRRRRRRPGSGHGAGRFRY